MPKPAKRQPSVSIVAPVFNEGENLLAFFTRLVGSLDGAPVSWSVIFVDDGSSDNSLQILRDLSQGDDRVGVLALSRNFGKELAVVAGIQAVHGDAVVIIDADLQHPPEVIPDLLASWFLGNKVVFAQRVDRSYQGPLRRAYSTLYYEIFSRLAGLRIPKGIGDFILLDRQAIDVMNRLGERARFNKGLFAWIGLPSALVSFAIEQRNAGQTSWSMTRLLRFAIDGIISFSSVPLRLSSFIGGAISVASICYALYLVISTIVYGTDLPGFPSIVVSIMFLAGVQMILLGIMGEYVARIFDEVKRRPLFVVSERIGAAATRSGPSDRTQNRRQVRSALRRRFRPLPKSKRREPQADR